MPDFDVPNIVADFEFEGYTWVVVIWPEGRPDGDRWQVYRDDISWYWKSQPHGDLRATHSQEPSS